MPRLREPSVPELRQKAEKALSSNHIGAARTHLEALLRVAREVDDRLFAHRHLAELCLEHDPWNAALHVRQILKLEPGDDVAEALMGLCQALLGNYEAAVAYYRRAAQANPDMPWYHHNVGHLLDVGSRAGHLRDDAVRLVGRDQVDAPLRTPVVVPATCHMGRFVFTDQTGDEVHEATDCVDRRAVGSLHGIGHAEERPEVERGGVEQEQALVGHADEPATPSRPARCRRRPPASAA